jgi:hypothetical protein
LRLLVFGGCLADPADRPDLYLRARRALDEGEEVGAGLLHSCREIGGRIRAEARRVAEELES